MTVDPRFYLKQEDFTVQTIRAEFLGNPGDGLDRDITGVSSFQNAQAAELCFIEDLKLLENLGGKSAFGLCLVPEAASGFGLPSEMFLAVERPKERFFEIAQRMYTVRTFGDDEDTGARPARDSVRLSPGVQIANGVSIGERTRIGANSVIGPGVQIGSDCEIGSNVSIQCSLVGNNVSVASGARLGEAGFGLMPSTASGMASIPHYGRVILQDHVGIGANTCVDRGLLDDTIIGEGTKIDNQGHIGHNTIVGRNTVMAAYAGISGSVVIGDNVRMGGRVGLVDHIRVGHGAQIAAGSAVMSSVPDNEVWAGAPAKPIRVWQRELIWLKNKARRDKTK